MRSNEDVAAAAPSTPHDEPAPSPQTNSPPPTAHTAFFSEDLADVIARYVRRHRRAAAQPPHTRTHLQPSVDDTERILRAVQKAEAELLRCLVHVRLHPDRLPSRPDLLIDVRASAADLVATEDRRGGSPTRSNTVVPPSASATTATATATATSDAPTLSGKDAAAMHSADSRNAHETRRGRRNADPPRPAPASPPSSSPPPPSLAALPKAAHLFYAYTHQHVPPPSQAARERSPPSAQQQQQKQPPSHSNTAAESARDDARRGRRRRGDGTASGGSGTRGRQQQHRSRSSSAQRGPSMPLEHGDSATQAKEVSVDHLNESAAVLPPPPAASVCRGVVRPLHNSEVAAALCSWPSWIAQYALLEKLGKAAAAAMIASGEEDDDSVLDAAANGKGEGGSSGGGAGTEGAAAADVDADDSGSSAELGGLLRCLYNTLEHTSITADTLHADAVDADAGSVAAVPFPSFARFYLTNDVASVADSLASDAARSASKRLPGSVVQRFLAQLTDVLVKAAVVPDTDSVDDSSEKQATDNSDKEEDEERKEDHVDRNKEEMAKGEKHEDDGKTEVDGGAVAEDAGELTGDLVTDTLLLLHRVPAVLTPLSAERAVPSGTPRQRKTGESLSSNSSSSSSMKGGDGVTQADGKSRAAKGGTASNAPAAHQRLVQRALRRLLNLSPSQHSATLCTTPLVVGVLRRYARTGESCSRPGGLRVRLLPAAEVFSSSEAAAADGLAHSALQGAVPVLSNGAGSPSSFLSSSSASSSSPPRRLETQHFFNALFLEVTGEDTLFASLNDPDEMDADTGLLGGSVDNDDALPLDEEEAAKTVYHPDVPAAHTRSQTNTQRPRNAMDTPADTSAWTHHRPRLSRAQCDVWQQLLRLVHFVHVRGTPTEVETTARYVAIGIRRRREARQRRHGRDEAADSAAGLREAASAGVLPSCASSPSLAELALPLSVPAFFITLTTAPPLPVCSAARVLCYDKEETETANTANATNAAGGEVGQTEQSVETHQQHQQRAVSSRSVKADRPAAAQPSASRFGVFGAGPGLGLRALLGWNRPTIATTTATTDSATASSPMLSATPSPPPPPPHRSSSPRSAAMSASSSAPFSPAPAAPTSVDDPLLSWMHDVIIPIFYETTVTFTSDETSTSNVHADGPHHPSSGGGGSAGQQEGEAAESRKAAGGRLRYRLKRHRALLGRVQVVTAALVRESANAFTSADTAAAMTEAELLSYLLCHQLFFDSAAATVSTATVRGEEATLQAAGTSVNTSSRRAHSAPQTAITRTAHGSTDGAAKNSEKVGNEGAAAAAAVTVPQRRAFSASPVHHGRPTQPHHHHHRRRVSFLDDARAQDGQLADVLATFQRELTEPGSPASPSLLLPQHTSDGSVKRREGLERETRTTMATRAAALSSSPSPKSILKSGPRYKAEKLMRSSAPATSVVPFRSLFVWRWLAAEVLASVPQDGSSTQSCHSSTSSSSSSSNSGSINSEMAMSHRAVVVDGIISSVLHLTSASYVAATQALAVRTASDVATALVLAGVQSAQYACYAQLQQRNGDSHGSISDRKDIATHRNHQMSCQDQEETAEEKEKEEEKRQHEEAAAVKSSEELSPQLLPAVCHTTQFQSHDILPLADGVAAAVVRAALAPVVYVAQPPPHLATVVSDSDSEEDRSSNSGYCFDGRDDTLRQRSEKQGKHEEETAPSDRSGQAGSKRRQSSSSSAASLLSPSLPDAVLLHVRTLATLGIVRVQRKVLDCVSAPLDVALRRVAWSLARHRLQTLCAPLFDFWNADGVAAMMNAVEATTTTAPAETTALRASPQLPRRRLSAQVAAQKHCVAVEHELWRRVRQTLDLFDTCLLLPHLTTPVGVAQHVELRVVGGDEEPPHDAAEATAAQLAEQCRTGGVDVPVRRGGQIPLDAQLCPTSPTLLSTELLSPAGAEAAVLFQTDVSFAREGEEERRVKRYSQPSLALLSPGSDDPPLPHPQSQQGQQPYSTPYSHNYFVPLAFHAAVADGSKESLATFENLRDLMRSPTTQQPPPQQQRQHVTHVRPLSQWPNSGTLHAMRTAAMSGTAATATTATAVTAATGTMFSTTTALSGASVSGSYDLPPALAPDCRALQLKLTCSSGGGLGTAASDFMAAVAALSPLRVRPPPAFFITDPQSIPSPTSSSSGGRRHNERSLLQSAQELPSTQVSLPVSIATGSEGVSVAASHRAPSQLHRGEGHGQLPHQPLSPPITTTTTTTTTTTSNNNMSSVRGGDGGSASRGASPSVPAEAALEPASLHADLISPMLLTSGSPLRSRPAPQWIKVQPYADQQRQQHQQQQREAPLHRYGALSHSSFLTLDTDFSHFTSQADGGRGRWLRHHGPSGVFCPPLELSPRMRLSYGDEGTPMDCAPSLAVTPGSHATIRSPTTQTEATPILFEQTPDLTHAPTQQQQQQQQSSSAHAPVMEGMVAAQLRRGDVMESALMAPFAQDAKAAVVASLLRDWVLPRWGTLMSAVTATVECVERELEGEAEQQTPQRGEKAAAELGQANDAAEAVPVPVATTPLSLPAVGTAVHETEAVEQGKQRGEEMEKAAQEPAAEQGPEDTAALRPSSSSSSSLPASSLTSPGPQREAAAIPHETDGAADAVPASDAFLPSAEAADSTAAAPGVDTNAAVELRVRQLQAALHDIVLACREMTVASRQFELATVLHHQALPRAAASAAAQMHDGVMDRNTDDPVAPAEETAEGFPLSLPTHESMRTVSATSPPSQDPLGPQASAAAFVASSRHGRERILRLCTRMSQLLSTAEGGAELAGETTRASDGAEDNGDVASNKDDGRLEDTANSMNSLSQGMQGPPPCPPPTDSDPSELLDESQQQRTRRRSSGEMCGPSQLFHPLREPTEMGNSATVYTLRSVVAAALQQQQQQQQSITANNNNLDSIALTSRRGSELEGTVLLSVVDSPPRLAAALLPPPPQEQLQGRSEAERREEEREERRGGGGAGGEGRSASMTGEVSSCLNSASTAHPLDHHSDGENRVQLLQWADRTNGGDGGVLSDTTLVTVAELPSSVKPIRKDAATWMDEEDNSSDHKDTPSSRGPLCLPVLTSPPSAPSRMDAQQQTESAAAAPPSLRSHADTQTARVETTRVDAAVQQAAELTVLARDPVAVAAAAHHSTSGGSQRSLETAEVVSYRRHRRQSQSQRTRHQRGAAAGARGDSSDSDSDSDGVESADYSSSTLSPPSVHSSERFSNAIASGRSSPVASLSSIAAGGNGSGSVVSAGVDVAGAFFQSRSRHPHSGSSARRRSSDADGVQLDGVSPQEVARRIALPCDPCTPPPSPLVDTRGGAATPDQQKKKKKMRASQGEADEKNAEDWSDVDTMRGAGERQARYTTTTNTAGETKAAQRGSDDDTRDEETDEDDAPDAVDTTAVGRHGNRNDDDGDEYHRHPQHHFLPHRGPVDSTASKHKSEDTTHSFTLPSLAAVLQTTPPAKATTRTSLPASPWRDGSTPTRRSDVAVTALADLQQRLSGSHAVILELQQQLERSESEGRQREEAMALLQRKLSLAEAALSAATARQEAELAGLQTLRPPPPLTPPRSAVGVNTEAARAEGTVQTNWEAEAPDGPATPPEQTLPSTHKAMEERVRELESDVRHATFRVDQWKALLEAERHARAVQVDQLSQQLEGEQRRRHRSSLSRSRSRSLSSPPGSDATPRGTEELRGAAAALSRTVDHPSLSGAAVSTQQRKKLPRGSEATADAVSDTLSGTCDVDDASSLSSSPAAVAAAGHHDLSNSVFDTSRGGAAQPALVDKSHSHTRVLTEQEDELRQREEGLHVRIRDVVQRLHSTESQLRDAQRHRTEREAAAVAEAAALQTRVAELEAAVAAALTRPPVSAEAAENVAAEHTRAMPSEGNGVDAEVGLGSPVMQDAAALAAELDSAHATLAAVKSAHAEESAALRARLSQAQADAQTHKAALAQESAAHERACIALRSAQATMAATQVALKAERSFFSRYTAAWWTDRLELLEQWSAQRAVLVHTAQLTMLRQQQTAVAAALSTAAEAATQHEAAIERVREEAVAAQAEAQRQHHAQLESEVVAAVAEARDAAHLRAAAHITTASAWWSAYHACAAQWLDEKLTLVSQAYDALLQHSAAALRDAEGTTAEQEEVISALHAGLSVAQGQVQEATAALHRSEQAFHLNVKSLEEAHAAREQQQQEVRRAQDASFRLCSQRWWQSRQSTVEEWAVARETVLQGAYEKRIRDTLAALAGVTAAAAETERRHAAALTQSQCVLAETQQLLAVKEAAHDREAAAHAQVEAALRAAQEASTALQRAQAAEQTRLQRLALVWWTSRQSALLEVVDAKMQMVQQTYAHHHHQQHQQQQQLWLSSQLQTPSTHPDARALVSPTPPRQAQEESTPLRTEGGSGAPPQRADVLLVSHEDPLGLRYELQRRTQRIASLEEQVQQLEAAHAADQHALATMQSLLAQSRGVARQDGGEAAAGGRGSWASPSAANAGMPLYAAHSGGGGNGASVASHGAAWPPQPLSPSFSTPSRTPSTPPSAAKSRRLTPNEYRQRFAGI